MKRTIKYVGLDVHQATTVAAVREAAGLVIARSVLPTDAPALVEFVRGMRGAIHVALEEGTRSRRSAQFCSCIEISTHSAGPSCRPCRP